MAVDRYREIVAAHRWNVPAQFNIGHACCARWARDRARFALYWEDESGATPRVHVLGPAAAREPAVQCPGGIGDRARRQGRAHPAAAAGDRRRAHGDVPGRRRRGAVVVPVRSRGARIPAERFRGEDRLRRSAVAAQSRADSRPLPGPCARDRRRRGGRGVDHAVRIAAEQGVVALHAGRHARGRSGAPRLHERNHGPAQGRADAAAMPARQPAGLRPFARRLPARGRPLLVAGRLGLDRRPHGRAVAGAVLRPADRRLPRAVRSRACARADGEVRGPQFVSVSDGAQDDDEGRLPGPGSASTSICARS